MANRPKGRPRTKREILNRIIALALSEPHILGKELQAKLEKEFNPKDVPGLRTIYQYMSNARKEAERNIQDQPWSLGTMDKAGIPWGLLSGSWSTIRNVRGVRRRAISYGR